MMMAIGMSKEFLCPMCGSIPRMISVVYEVVERKTVSAGALSSYPTGKVQELAIVCFNWHYWTKKEKQ